MITPRESNKTECLAQFAICIDVNIDDIQIAACCQRLQDAVVNHQKTNTARDAASQNGGWEALRAINLKTDASPDINAQRDGVF